MSYKELVEKFSDVKLMVIGDIILDHYIWGKVDRISPEAPVVVVSVDKEEHRAGGAGNVATNVSSLGSCVELVGVVGEDRAAGLLKSSLESFGVSGESFFSTDSRPTTQKSRVVASSQQVVRVDWEETGELGEKYDDYLLSIIESRIDDVDAIICSDYGKGALASSVLFEKLSELKSKGKIGLGTCPVVVDPKAPHFSMYKGATVIKPNKKEASEASGVYIKSRVDALEAAKILRDKWQCDLVLITLGELGMVLYDGNSYEIPTVAKEVYDVSGAGDTVSAIFAAALAVGASAEVACNLANFGAGVVVSEVGTVALKKQQLLEAIDEHC